MLQIELQMFGSICNSIYRKLYCQSGPFGSGSTLHKLVCSSGATVLLFFLSPCQRSSVWCSTIVMHSVSWLCTVSYKKGIRPEGRVSFHCRAKNSVWQSHTCSGKLRYIANFVKTSMCEQQKQPCRFLWWSRVSWASLLKHTARNDSCVGWLLTVRAWGKLKAQKRLWLSDCCVIGHSDHAT